MRCDQVHRDSDYIKMNHFTVMIKSRQFLLKKNVVSLFDVIIGLVTARSLVRHDLIAEV